MAIQGQQPGEKKLQDLFGGGSFWENVDWPRTKAYSMGLGQIYLNLEGREGHGAVSASDANAVTDAIAARLLTMTDPNTGATMVDAVYKRDDVYKGPFVKNASELQVGFADGYRVSWQTSLGGSPPGIVYPNMKKWSGDHGSFDYKQTSGVLMSNRAVGGGRSTSWISRDGIEVLRRADTVRYRWQADLLRRRQRGRVGAPAIVVSAICASLRCSLSSSRRHLRSAAEPKARPAAPAKGCGVAARGRPPRRRRANADQRRPQAGNRAAVEIRRAEARGRGRGEGAGGARRDAGADDRARGFGEEPDAELRARLVEIYKLGQGRICEWCWGRAICGSSGSRGGRALAALDRERINRTRARSRS